MAHHQLGHHEEAKNLLTSLREAMSLLQGSNDAVALTRSLGNEAEALVEGRTPDRKQ
jgi:hypothetical protein